MNTDICVSHRVFDDELRAGRSADGELSVGRVHLRWCGRDECVRHRVLSRIAALEMSDAVLRMARRRGVLMRGKTVVVLRVIVIAVGVRVQQRRQTDRRNQRRDEQQREDAVHMPSL